MLHLGMRSDKIIEQQSAAEAITVPGCVSRASVIVVQRLTDRLRKG